MTIRIRGFLAALVLTLVAWPAFAQIGPATGMLDRLADELDLDQGQRAAAQAALDEADQAPGARSWALAATLKDVLSEEQKASLLERGRIAGAYEAGVRQGERSSRFRGDRQKRGERDRRPDMRRHQAGMAEALNLTEEQQETIRIHRALTALAGSKRMHGPAGMRHRGR